ncbi:hypothetical protein PSHT_00765 [Puccinia striiformis]|uniref:Uncharacterized protein n=1 Tax=Puccinia striiformis TaxID=27350 RepID=A0A2S4WM50_9BASI|nr:hypothetical protein PSHT_00765 [Puccinia striiformis]
MLSSSFLLQVGWLLINPKVLAWPGQIGSPENDGTLLDIVTSSRSHVGMPAGPFPHGSSSWRQETDNQHAPSDLRYQSLIQPSQDLSALEADLRSSFQHGDQRAIHHREEFISHEAKKQRVSEVQTEGNWIYTYPAAASAPESRDRFLTTSRLSTSQSGSRFGAFSHQTHTHHQPPQPPAAQPPAIQRTPSAWGDVQHFPGFNSFGDRDFMNPRSTSKVHTPTYHLNPSRGAVPSAMSSFLWPPDLEGFDDPQSLTYIDEWLNRSEFLEPHLKATEDHLVEIVKLESSIVYGLYSFPCLLADRGRFHEENEQNDAHAVRSVTMVPDQEPVGTLRAASSTGGSDHQHFTEHVINDKSQIQQVTSSGSPVDHEDDSPHDVRQQFEANPQDVVSGMSLEDMPVGELERMLRKFKYPHQSMTPEFLAHFTQRFKTEIKHHFGNYRVSASAYKEHKIDGFPAVMDPILHVEDAFVIRVIGSPGRVEAHNSRTLTGLFEKIIRWLVFINTAILRKSNSKEDPERELFSNKRVTEWLLKKSFYPCQDSLPVLGIAKISQSRRTEPSELFGPIQKLLLRYLTEKSSLEDEIKICISAIQLCNREMDQKLGTSHMDDGPNILPNVKSIMYKAALGQMKIGYPKVPPSEHIRRIGNFEILDLDQFPTPLQPGRYASIPTIKLGPHENIIMDSLIKDRLCVTKSMEKTPVIGLPVQLAGQSTREEDLPSEFIIRIMDNVGKVTIKRHMVSKLKFLFYYLDFSHRLLLQHLISVENKQVKNTEEQFSEWLARAILYPEDGSYPVFGRVMIMGLSEKIFDKSNFKAVQTLLIHYFSDKDSHDRVVQVALALLGWWYKNKTEHYFETDDMYWNTMIVSLMRFSH